MLFRSMGVKAGLDPKIMIDVINSGSGMNTASRDKFPKAILPRTFDFGFATALMYKDVDLCMREAATLGVQMPVADAVHDIWQQTNAAWGGSGTITFSAVGQACTLQYINSRWFCIGNNGASFA